MKKVLFVKLIILLLLTSCDVPGPWEYDVTETSVYRGIYLSGYVIAGRPVENICFERLYSLNEVYTTNFAFYDSADVLLYSGSDSVVLQPDNDAPNCFISDSVFMPSEGNDYTLNATIHWDSSEVPVVTQISAIAQVPEKFLLKDTARYEYPALQPPPAEGDTIGRLVYLVTLDDEVRDSVLVSFGVDPSLVDFSQIDPLELTNSGAGGVADSLDTLAPGFDFSIISDALYDNWDSIYSKILYYDSTRERAVFYQQGDTINYLYGNQNLSSHYYPSDYSDGVGAILVTHEFSDSAVFGVTRFSDLVGLGAQPEDAYYSGTKRRLITYDNTALPNGSRLFDNIPVTNYWLVGGKNSLYFYAFENFYQEYVTTAVSNEEDSKVNAVYNVEGARGFFVGGTVDTFNLYVQIDPTQQYFTREETFVGFCNEQVRWGEKYGGWDGERDCREYLVGYCEDKNFQIEPCAQLLVEKNLIEGKDSDDKTIQDSIWGALIDSIQLEIEMIDSTSDEGKLLKNERSIYQDLLKDSLLLERNRDKGTERYCVRNNFPSTVCDSLKKVAHDVTKQSSVKDYLITYCEDSNWDIDTYTQCAQGLVVYVEQFKMEGYSSPVLESIVELYCEENPSEKVCNK